MFERFVSNSNELLYLSSLLKISLFRACVKEEEEEAIVFTFLLSTVVYFSPYFRSKKSKAFFPCIYFSYIQCHWDPVLYLLLEGLKAVVTMQDSTLPETGSQFIFWKWIISLWERRGRSKQKHMYLFCAV